MRKISQMRSATEMLALIKHSFGDADGLVERSFSSDREFRSICKDYYDCKQALERWQASDAEVAGLRLREYAELLADLGRDIRECLEKLRKPA